MTLLLTISTSRSIDPLAHRVLWTWQSKFGVGKKGIIHELAVVFESFLGRRRIALAY
jgi:hypothetical protein